MIVRVDTETTGLDPERGHLLEVALAVTDDDLRELAYMAAVVQPITPLSTSAWVEHLDPFIQDMHGKSGLLAEIEAERGERRHEAEAAFCSWMKDAAIEWNFDLKKMPLAGSTVGFARAWLRRHMPAIESLFHYRSIDVLSLTELAARWAPDVYEGRPKAAGAHRALADVRESIDYLRYYRERSFVGGGTAVPIPLIVTPPPSVATKKRDPAVTFQPHTVDCPYCRNEHHHGGAGRRPADCGLGEYVVEIGGVS